MSELPDAFETFFNRIELDALAEDRIASAWQRLREVLVAAYEVPAGDVFVQGSTANETAIQPCSEDGEVDLDIVAHGVTATATPAEAIRYLRVILSADADLKARLEPDEEDRPCVRLRYARHQTGYGFHIDITPARTGQQNGPLDVPMRGREGWKPTAPREYTRWCRDQGEAFRRTVRMLKRWRDHQDAAIKSITLQVLIGTQMPAGSDAMRLVGALEGIRDALATSPTTSPVVANPVLPSENLARRWSDADYRRFRVAVGEAAGLARRALDIHDQQESHKMWRALLGEDFPDRAGGGHVVPPPPPSQPSRRPNPDRGRTYG